MRLELLKWMRDNKVYYHDLITLLRNSDEIILGILNCENENLRASLVQDFSGYFFRNKDDEFKMKILEIITSTEGEKQAEYALKVARDENVLGSTLSLKLIRIVANAKGEGQAKYGSHIIFNAKSLLGIGHVVELTQIVANAIGEKQAEYASKVACNGLVRGQRLERELTQIVANAIGEKQAECASEVALYERVLYSCHALELTQIVANAKGESQAEYASKVACNGLVRDQNLEIELTQMVANAIGEKQAEYATKVALDEYVLKSGHALELTQMVANAIGEKQAEYACKKVLTPYVLESGHVGELAQAITNAETTKIAESISRLIDDMITHNIDLSKLLIYLPVMSGCKEEQIADYIRELIIRMVTLGAGDYLFLVEKIASGEYLEQFEKYLENTIQIQRALETRSINNLITNLESYSNPDEKLKDVLKNRVKRI